DPRPAEEMAGWVLRPLGAGGTFYWVALVILAGAVVVGGLTWLYQMYWGIGVTGLNRPVMWAVYITNFVYFIGIGVAGTFISAVLRLLNFSWRAPVTRAAETLTVFALATSALFPLIHLGRTWKSYWMLPYPNQRQMWPSYHSALIWDMTAILTYLSSSILFAWLAMLPDLGLARDRFEDGWRHTFFEILAVGWRGTERQWRTLKAAITLFSLAIIPVMVFMHTIVGWDFAMAIQPGWHSSVFGPYFVSGALLSGVAAVIILMAILRRTLHLEYFLRPEHFDGMAKLLLLFSIAWAYMYFNDFLVPWYGQGPPEKVIQRLFERGQATPLWALMLFTNVLLPWVTLWSRRLRTSVSVVVAVSVMVQIGMYLERYLIVAVTLGRNELPFDWGSYLPRWPEILITIGAFSLVGLLFLLSVKLLPMIPLWEVQEGQMLRTLRRIGAEVLPTRAELK
ncbi:MAG: polysulfide reductase NrfD, partial [Anaerolineae bacterium]